LPICFLTERMIDEELKRDISALLARAPVPVSIVRKYNDEDMPIFIAFLKALKAEMR
jgi:hypothetical protein